MITEDYVSFEVAKLLKEKGFDTFKPYGWDEELFDKEYPRNFSIGFDNKEHWISCPTHQVAMKWLREMHGLIISIEYQIICPTWKWRIYIKSSDDKHTDFQHYNKYEEAVESALKYCLENLI